MQNSTGTLRRDPSKPALGLGQSRMTKMHMPPRVDRPPEDGGGRRIILSVFMLAIAFLFAIGIAVAVYIFL